MPSKRHSAEQIVRKLREAEVELARGATVKDACRKLAITEHTYYRWRREYGGLKLNQARKLKRLRILAKSFAKTGRVAPSRGPRLRPGAQLVRQWRGETYLVTVTESGFEHAGELYGSLSSIARRITGAHCSGPRFFGIQKASKRSS